MSYAGSTSQQPVRYPCRHLSFRDMALSLCSSDFQHLEPSDPNTIYPATVLQLLRAEQPHPRSNFFLDGIKLERVLRQMSPDNKSSYMHHLGHLRCMYC